MNFVLLKFQITKGIMLIGRYTTFKKTLNLKLETIL